MPFDALALDAGARSYDQDGRLHVRVSHVSKACVNPYRGREIPGAEALGLDLDKVYQLLRDPEELARSVPTWNGLPLLIKHTPVSADDPQRDAVVGSLGTDASFRPPYLDNSLTVWDGEAIAGVESGQQRQLSGGYHYRADMTPGTWRGQAYDGVMRDIRGNHVALVEAGRAGNDVLVMDAAFEESAHPRGEGGQFSAEPGGKTEYSHASSNPAHPAFKKARATAHAHVRYLQALGHEGAKVTKRIQNLTVPGKGVSVSATYTAHHGTPKGAMDAQPKGTTMIKNAAASPRRVAARNMLALGALQVYLPPKLAADARLPDLGRLLRGAKDDREIAARVAVAMKPLLARDADLKDLDGLIDHLKGPAMQPDGGETLTENPDDTGLGDPEGTNEALLSEDDDLEEKIRELLAGKLDDADMEMLMKLIRPAEEDMPPDAAAPPDDAPPADAPPAEAAPPPDAPPAADPPPDDAPPPFAKKDEADDRGFRRGRDALPPSLKENQVDKPAMDAAIKVASDAAVAEAIKKTTARLNARTDAERFVRPWIGEVTVAMDTADDVYRTALDAVGVPTKDVHPSAFRAMLALVPKPGDARPSTRVAMDSAGVADFAARFPGAARLRVVG